MKTLTPRIRNTLVSSVVAIGAMAGLLFLATTSGPEDPAPPPEAAARGRRAFTLHDARPSLSREEVEQHLDASDRVLRDLADAGVDDVATEIRRRMNSVEVTEAERRAFYDEHRERFGGRSYERSRAVVDRLLRIRAVWEGLARDAG